VKHPPYRLASDRLVLRCWNPETDPPRFKAAVDSSVDHLKPWMPWAADEPKPVEAKHDLCRFFRSQFDLGKEYVYGLFSPDETEVWGGCGLHRRAGPECLEIGYWLVKHREGQGLATEAARLLTEAAFGLPDIDRVEIRHDPRNLRSGRVPAALGYEDDGVRRRDCRDADGTLRDTRVWVKFRGTE